jgi:3-oxoacyl-[acyl-carrier-protein] synthase III
MLYAKILATGGRVPDRVVGNTFFQYLVDDADQWIFSRTGIRERRFAAPDEATSDLATAAANQALASGGIDPLTIDCLIVATSTPDMILPPTASMVQKNIGAANAFAFDMNAVCSGFVYAVEAADNFIKSGKYRRVMVIGADCYSKILDMQDKTTCPLFGDGAGALILEAVSEQRGILATSIESDGSRWDLIQVPSSGTRKPVTPETIALRENTFKMSGRAVYTFATDIIPKLIAKVSDKAGVDPAAIDFIIPHQANIRIIDVITKKTGIPAEKILINLDRYGNTAAASVGLALDENLRNGVIGAGSLVLIMGFGGGLSWGGILISI